jgi:hypothetical protein
MMRSPAKIWNPLASKPRFFAYSLLCFGTPLAVSMVASFGRPADYAQWLVLILLSLGGASLWAATTWPYFRRVNERLEQAAKDAVGKQ